MEIKFCGAAKTVTGSQHLLTINGKKLLLDCGLYQGKREESYRRNKDFLFNPEQIQSVILSHAHIDHSGNLPTLYKKGFRGNIYCTSATRDLCSIMLQDSAHIQEKDIEYVNKKKSRKGEKLFNPLYTISDALNVLKQFKSMPYQNKFYIDGFDNKVAVTFIEAGHILGSAQVLLEINEGSKKIRFGFTGDVGRWHLPILKDPEFMGDVDYLISESTYGGRVHDKATEMDSQLQKVILDAYQSGGKIIVPAFSVGRTQEIVYSISKLYKEKKIPHIPIFVDSPLSVNATEVFKMHPECFDDETAKLISDGIDIFGLSYIRYVKDVEESKSLNSFEGCCMIISASGMCEAGRILHHLKNNIEDKRNTILIIGFQAEHTLGRRLVESVKNPGMEVNIFGEPYPIRAKVVVLNSFSAHADENELQKFFNYFNRKDLKRIFLVHGETDMMEALKTNLENMDFKNIYIPDLGETVILKP